MAVATVSLRDHISDELLAAVARILSRASSPSFVEGTDIPVEPELEPFLNWDDSRGHGRGYFRSDADECASRRVDLRGPTDLDPGPLPMEEATGDVPAQTLSF